MPEVTNPYAFSADYSAMATCLSAIRQQQNAGAFAGDAVLLNLINVFDKDLILKLYNRALRVIGIIDGTTPGDLSYQGGDFDPLDFSGIDFGVGRLQPGTGDFSTRFQLILQWFTYFNGHLQLITTEDKAGIDAALIPVLDAFDELQEYLDRVGLNPCAGTGTGDAYQNNSSSLFLQTSGADGRNGIAAGIHLRWSLAGELGENHFPRGNYSNSAGTGYNKPDDYVTIDRTVYNAPKQILLDLENARPVISFFLRQWTYVVNHSVNDTLVSDRVRITFADGPQYEEIAIALNPLISTFEFLKRYEGLLRVEVVHKNVFSVGYDFRNSGTAEAVLKIQGHCFTDTTNTENSPILIRSTVTAPPGQLATDTIYGENIYALEIWKTGSGYLQSLSFETYADFLNSKTSADWSPVGGNFALELTDQVVFDRLETAVYPIDNLWPQYTGGSKVRIANYHDKWLTSRTDDPSIKAAVTRYLELSETDPRAVDTLRQEDSDPESPGLEISYLDILHILSLDYHIARMLGLGFIDTPSGGDNQTRYVYRVNYTARTGPGATTTSMLQCISLPTSKADHRKPDQPAMRELNYAFPQSEQQNPMVDGQGYAKYDDARVINIGRQPYPEEIEGYDFFTDMGLAVNSNPFTNPRPALYGIEYRPDSHPAYVKPEITNQKATGQAYNAYNANYPNGVLETVPVPDNQLSLYIHFEKQEGIHHYAIYGIDLLARGSDTSAEAATDATAFPNRNRLAPPSDFNVQYIQQEDTLIFTTALEQRWLDWRSDRFPGGDINFTRITFNWLDFTNISYLQDTSDLAAAMQSRPDKIGAFFRTILPMEVIGTIYNIIPVSGSESQLKLFTRSYEMIDGKIVQPNIAAGDINRFMGSLLSTKEGQFSIVAMIIGSQGPVITIEMSGNLETVEDAAEPSFYAAKKMYQGPAINSRFSIIENMTTTGNWSPVSETISLVDPGSPALPVVETSTDNEGNVTTYMVGGINAGAIITPVAAEAGAPALPGYYLISFSNGTVLNPHPQVNLPYNPDHPDANNPATLQTPHVEWNKGLVRVPLAGNPNEKKMLQVFNISQFNPLVIYAYDPAYQDYPVKVSASANDLVSGVNFHPGYKAYLFPEPSPVYSYNRNSLMPGPGEDSRKITFGLQTINSRSGHNFQSSVSVPNILLTQKLVAPEQLNAPLIQSYKVRPDLTGKAALTFDNKIEPDNDGLLRKPFGFMFYRTNEEEVLYALYQPETLKQVMAAIDSLTTDNYHNRRFSELVNVVLDNDDHFHVYDAEPAPYGFPDPDKTGLIADDDNSGERYAKYLDAVRATLLPLTENPVINGYIKDGYQTENKLPVTRTIDGKLLDPADPAFDAFPMARKYAGDGNNYFIRFTDYTLTESSRKLHFYTTAEVTNQLIPGRLSYKAGPVTVLHTMPAAPPVVRSMAISATLAFSGSPVQVLFRLSPFSPADEITGIRIFRTLDKGKTVSTAFMDTYIDLPVTADTAVAPEVADTFAGVAKVPLGETVYYRLAAIRTIINEKEQAENIFSLASPVITVNLIDITNPVAPDITYSAGANDLTWPAATNKGTYYLYRQNSRGNWEKIFTSKPDPGTNTVVYPLSAPLPPTDEDGNHIYYRFKVKVENASGLLNLTDKELTI
jgi:hypothetical protein